jgi:hypothetical protein
VNLEVTTTSNRAGLPARFLGPALGLGITEAKALVTCAWRNPENAPPSATKPPRS